MKGCKVRIGKQEHNLVCLVKRDNKLFAMIAGGFEIEVDEVTFNVLYEKLSEHFDKHFKKK